MNMLSQAVAPQQTAGAEVQEKERWSGPFKPDRFGAFHPLFDGNDAIFKVSELLRDNREAQLWPVDLPKNQAITPEVLEESLAVAGLQFANEFHCLTFLCQDQLPLITRPVLMFGWAWSLIGNVLTPCHYHTRIAKRLVHCPVIRPGRFGLHFDVAKLYEERTDSFDVLVVPQR